ncbi:hypothetical protein L596_014118 [Steinernema carpocapsae]|uniref:Uncharacterized protein n=1 Tax=Steinernema carpocapsae TaxID=34508 RepID=A0A4U5NB13_STECR|nr:hypothetical protein L596_014118 [Steinernema carpocapsae]
MFSSFCTWCCSTHFEYVFVPRPSLGPNPIKTQVADVFLIIRTDFPWNNYGFVRQWSSVALIACSLVLGTLAAYDPSPQAVQKRFESCESVVQPQANGSCLLLSAFNAHLLLLSRPRRNSASRSSPTSKPRLSETLLSRSRSNSPSPPTVSTTSSRRISPFSSPSRSRTSAIGSWGCFCDLYPTAVQVSGTTVGDLLDDVGGVIEVLLKAIHGLAGSLLSLLQSVLSVVLVSKIVGSLTDQLASCAQVVLQLFKTMPSLVKPLFEVSFGMWGNFQMFFDVCMNTYRYLLVPDLFVLVDGEFQLVLDLQSALNNATFNWLRPKSPLCRNTLLS